ncbi:MAG: aspartyl protease family protein [Terricaulis sp.]
MRLLAWTIAALACLCIEVRAETLSLEPYVEGRGLLTARVDVEGRPALLLFDTGAGVTLTTPSFAQQIGCTPFGSFTGFRMRGDRLDMQKCGARDIRVGSLNAQREIAVLDLGALLGAGAPPIDGIMGLDVFDGRLITLALADREIWLDERPGRGWREGVARFQREAGGAGLSIFVRAEARGNALWLLLDSGSVGSFAYLSPGALEQLGEATDQPVQLSISGAGEHEMEAQRVEALIYDGVLGERFLRQFDIAVDFRTSRIWWRPHQARRRGVRVGAHD